MLLRALLLLLVTAVACAPTWSLPDLDGTEGRRVQIALEMLRSGDWLVPSLGGEPTWAKPPLHYWLLALFLQFGDGLVWLRLPSVLGAFALALLAGELLRTRFSAATGWVASLGIATGPIVLTVWPTIEIDPLFASFTAMSLLLLAVGVADGRRWFCVAAGLLGGLALLQKGPPYFLFAAGAWVVWWRQARLRGFVSYLLPMLVVAMAYYAPLWLFRVKPGDMLAVANEESVGRLLFLDWEHIKPIPEYWLRALAVMLPFGAFAWYGRGRAEPTAGQAVLVRSWAWAALLAFAALTIFPGRPTRYLLPGIPLLVCAFAPRVTAFALAAGPLPLVAKRVSVLVGVVASIALLVLPFVPRAGVAALGFAAVAAIAAASVRCGRDVVACCLLLPVVASWTVGWERARRWLSSPRERQSGGALLGRELAQFGVAPADLRTIGHFDSPLLLAAGLLPPGDEFARGEWRGRWVLHEVDPRAVASTPHADVSLRPPAAYVARLRLDLPFKSFVLRERVEAPK